MAPGLKKGGKEKRRVAPSPLSKKTSKKQGVSPLFPKTPRSFRIGRDIQPRRNLSRFVKWPKYIVLQRQRRVLLQRLKVPPAINQFTHTLDKNQSSQLIRLLAKYKAESKGEKKERLENTALRSEQSGTKKPILLKYGINHVTELVETKKAKLVIIAHDVDPIEIVCWLPTLCRRQDIPYCIVKSKSRLGKLVHKKTCSVIAVDNVRKEDQSELESQVKLCRALFNENVEVRRRWGGGALGIKSRHAQEKKDRLLNIELQKKVGLKG